MVITSILINITINANKFQEVHISRKNILEIKSIAGYHNFMMQFILYIFASEDKIIIFTPLHPGHKK